VGNLGSANLLLAADGTGGFVEFSLQGELDSTYGVAVADLDDDGLLDIVFANSGTADQLLIGAGFDASALANPFVSSTIPGGASESRAAAVSDIDNDGDLDLIIMKHFQAVTVYSRTHCNAASTARSPRGRGCVR